MKESEKHVIWSNSDLYIDDYRDSYEEFCSINDIEYNPTESKLYDYMCEENDEQLECEKFNINRETNLIMCFATLGLWDGARKAAKPLGYNLNTIFDCPMHDYNTFYVEHNEVWCDATHHDGTNCYQFRMLKDGLTEDDFRQSYERHVLSGEMDGWQNLIEETTDSLAPFINAVYGW